MKFDQLIERVSIYENVETMDEGFKDTLKYRVLPAAIGIASGVLHGTHLMDKPDSRVDKPITTSITRTAKEILGKPIDKTIDKPVAKPIDKPVTKPVATPRTDPYIEKKLIDLVKKMEGFAPKAYWDIKQYSIGYGSKATPDEIKNKNTISEVDAHNRLLDELDTHKQRVLTALAKTKFHLSDEQIKALISFDYNTGRGRIAVLNNKTQKGVAEYISSIVFADGKKSKGLEIRRVEELSQFLGLSQQSVRDKYF